MNNNYSSISSFGSNAYSPVNNPLTYCLNNNMDQRFLHGSNADTYGQHSRPCQLFLSEYCASKWDNYCEVASRNTESWTPNNLKCSLTGCNNSNNSAGEMLVRNTAARKYLVKMIGATKKYEPFDPNVPTSPLISYWVSDNKCSPHLGARCLTPIYAVNPKTIDNDIVMDKLLAKPTIAPIILVNIYNTMKRMGTLKHLKGTKLGHFYTTNPYFNSKGGL